MTVVRYLSFRLPILSACVNGCLLCTNRFYNDQWTENWSCTVKAKKKTRPLPKLLWSLSHPSQSTQTNQQTEPSRSWVIIQVSGTHLFTYQLLDIFKKCLIFLLRKHSWVRDGLNTSPLLEKRRFTKHLIHRLLLWVG